MTNIHLCCSRPRARSAAAAPMLAVLALALAACAPGQPTKPRSEGPPVNLSGYSPTFKAGFADGCETARGNGRRDEKRFAAESQYARGWQDGNAICAKR